MNAKTRKIVVKDLQATLVERSALESDLRRALERRQLRLY